MSQVQNMIRIDYARVHAEKAWDEGRDECGERWVRCIGWNVFLEYESGGLRHMLFFTNGKGEVPFVFDEYDEQSMEHLSQVKADARKIAVKFEFAKHELYDKWHEYKTESTHWIPEYALYPDRPEFN